MAISFETLFAFNYLCEIFLIIITVEFSKGFYIKPNW